MSINNISRIEPAKVTFDDKRFFKVQFIDDFDKFIQFIENSQLPHTPILDMGNPVDHFGTPQFGDRVVNVSYLLMAPQVIVMHIETERDKDE